MQRAVDTFVLIVLMAGSCTINCSLVMESPSAALLVTRFQANSTRGKWHAATPSRLTSGSSVIDSVKPHGTSTSSTRRRTQFAIHQLPHTPPANGALRNVMVSLASIAVAAVFAVITQFSSLQSTEAAFGCAEAPASPGDRRTDKSQLKVTTFNAAFLFLGTASHGLSCPGSDCPWTTAADAQSHVIQIASVIKSLNSDIIQINELKALGDSTYKPYLVKGTDTSTGQNSALLTRVDPVVDLQRTEVRATIPVSGSTCPSSSGYSSTKGVSKHFYTTFNVTGFSKPLTLVGAHLLANPESKPRCFEREAQATVLASLGNAAVGEGHHTIITGDLNDWSAAVLDKNNNAPISAVLSILTGTNFIDVASKVAQSDRYTEWYDEDNDCVYEDTELSSLDHMLVSKSLSSALRSVTFNHDLYTTSCSGYNSDHYPVSIILKEA